MPVVCGVLMWAAAGANAQGADPEHAVGAVSVTNQIANQPGLTPAQRAAASATANRVIAILRRAPMIANPVGHTVGIRAAAFPRQPGDAPGVPYHVIIFVRSRYFALGDNGRGGKSVDADAIGLDVTIGVNAAGYPAEMENTDAEADHGTRIMGADEAGLEVYRTTGSFHGKPFYGGSCTYLTHRSVPPIVPVTKERYLNIQLLTLRGSQAFHDKQRAQDGAYSSNKQLQEFLRGRPAREAQNQKTFDALKSAGASEAQLQQMKEEMAKVEKQQEEALRKSTTDGTDQRMNDIVAEGRAGEAHNVAQQQAQLDALSPAERRSPVAVVAEGRHVFQIAQSMEDTTALPLMQPNASFYDTSLGPDAAQLIWICGYHLQGLEDRGYERLAEGSDSWRQEKAYNERRIRDIARFRDQLDWNALDALLKP
jgi:hypothetical protein